MALLIDIKHPEWMTDESMREQLLACYPAADIRVGKEPGSLEEIDMLTVSSYYPGEALKYPRLRLIQKTGAGVDNILADDGLPETIAVARLYTSTSGAEMAEYALAYVLQEQRHMRQYHEQQARSEWRHYPPRQARDTNVAVLGLGRIGQLMARRFADNGFAVIGWSRGPKTLDGVRCYAGPEELPRVVGEAEYVVSVLPSTPETRGLYDAELFARFNPRALFINVGRGDQVVEADLVGALDAECLAGAVLDVMSEEPLPADSPLWLHPKVQLTPHVSGYHLGEAVADIAENYRRLQNGEPLLHLIDRERGY
ncbi:MAG: glyoxylate/hydroxypyruvate reductase A [Gammaproteobacteria bacterium]|jgi:glyoxylate/hydroxypyruvate reductase A